MSIIQKRPICFNCEKQLEVEEKKSCFICGKPMCDDCFENDHGVCIAHENDSFPDKERY